MPELPILNPELPRTIPETSETRSPENAPRPTIDHRGEQPENVPVAVQPLPTPIDGPAPMPPTGTPLQRQVEDVMSDGLADAYAQMDPATQATFKTSGEVTAGKISQLLQSGKSQAKKIVELLVAWLRIIPGMNAFFFEQEAKIKTDKIMALKSRH